MCCGLVATSSTMSLDRLGGLCSWDTAIFAMAWVGGSACAGGGLWGAGAETCAGGGPLDLPRPTGAACSRWASWGPSPGLRAASPPPPPRPRPLLLPLARPVMMSSSCHASETKKTNKTGKLKWKPNNLQICTGNSSDVILENDYCLACERAHFLGHAVRDWSPMRTVVTQLARMSCNRQNPGF